MFKTTSPAVAGTSAELTAKSTPELSSLLWARYTESCVDTKFHLVLNWNVGGSVLIGCNGRWPISAASEVNASPQHEERCDACQEIAIEVKRVEQGLAELSAFEGEGG